MSAYRRMFFPAYATSNYDSTHGSHLTSIVIWTRVVLVSITTSCDSVPMLLQLPLTMTSSMITYTPFPSCVVPYGYPSQLCSRSTMTSIGVNIHTREHQAIEKNTILAASYHLHDLAPIDKTCEALSMDLALAVLTGQELVPPPEEEVARDELEPGRERVRCKCPCKYSEPSDVAALDVLHGSSNIAVSSALLTYL